MKHKKISSILLSILLMIGFSVANASDSTNFHNPFKTKTGKTTILASGVIPQFRGSALIQVTTKTCPDQTKPELELSLNSIMQTGVARDWTDALTMSGTLVGYSINLTNVDVKSERSTQGKAGVAWIIYCVPIP